MHLVDLVRKWLRWSGPLPEDAAARLVARVDADGLSYLGIEALSDLVWAMNEANRLEIPGAVLETGCALGGSAIVLAAAKGAERKLNLYDVFGMIPPPSEQDGPETHERYEVIRSGQSEGLKGGDYYGYEPDLLATVVNNFVALGYLPQDHNVHFIKGLYEDTLTVTGPVALAHIDCDWYASVKLCLERIGPRVSPGGRMIIDDYDYYGGCRKAVDEFLTEQAGRFALERHARVHLVRLSQ